MSKSREALRSADAEEKLLPRGPPREATSAEDLMKIFLLLITLFGSHPLAAPTHLVVLQHGLYGNAINLRVLHDELLAAAPEEVLVHLAEVRAFSTSPSALPSNPP